MQLPPFILAVAAIHPRMLAMGSQQDDFQSRLLGLVSQSIDQTAQLRKDMREDAREAREAHADLGEKIDDVNENVNKRIDGVNKDMSSRFDDVNRRQWQIFGITITVICAIFAGIKYWS